MFERTKNRRGRLVVRALCLVATVSVAALSGCGGSADTPALGRVTGKVIVENQPIANAYVEFIPDNGRVSSAITGSSGEFDLIYSPQAMGAVPGHHVVHFSIPVAEDKSETVGMSDGERKRYLSQRTKLKQQESVEVKQGENTFEFAITSKDPPDEEKPAGRAGR